MSNQQQPQLKKEEEEALIAEFTDRTLKEVVVDGLVVLKIVKHCQDNLPESVTGQLVGLDVGQALQVTNVIPIPQQEEDDDDDALEHSLATLRSLREVNMDSDTVGFYTSAYSESQWMDLETIGLQFEWQKSPKAVLLVFDPLRTTQLSVIALKAYRLTVEFQQVYAAFAAGKLTVEAMRDAGVSFNDIFEEVPVRINNGAAATAMLSDLAEDDALLPDRERLDLSVYPFLEKNTEWLMESLDSFAGQQQRYLSYQRFIARNSRKKKTEDPASQQQHLEVKQPSQTESLLLQSHIASYCDHISEVAALSSSKLFMLNQVKSKQSGK